MGMIIGIGINDHIQVVGISKVVVAIIRVETLKETLIQMHFVNALKKIDSKYRKKNRRKLEDTTSQNMNRDTVILDKVDVEK